MHGFLHALQGENGIGCQHSSLRIFNSISLAYPVDFSSYEVSSNIMHQEPVSNSTGDEKKRTRQTLRYHFYSVNCHQTMTQAVWLIKNNNVNCPAQKWHIVTRAWHIISSLYFLPADEVESVRVTLDLEWDAVRRRSSLRSLASFKRWASSFWYSAASSRFLVARRRLSARRWRLRCSTRGVTSRWILGAFVWGFLPNNHSQVKHLCICRSTPNAHEFISSHGTQCKWSNSSC